MLRWCVPVVEHVVFSIRIPKTLAEQIDENIESTGHSNRNDFVRSACRFYLLELLRNIDAQDCKKPPKSEEAGRT